MLAAALVLGACAAAAASREPARLARVVDGDTIVLADGRRVRLLQIDTPEPGSAECFSRAAGRELRRLLPAGAPLTLEADPALDAVDRYGRLLRYVWSGGRNVNLELVRRGAATVWLYDGERGHYAGALLAAGRAARAARRGLWGACPGAVWNPLAPATTGAARAATTPEGIAGARCDPSYSGACLPSPPPDLDCVDVGRTVRVRPPDPHHLDGDGDGLGCER